MGIFDYFRKKKIDNIVDAVKKKILVKIFNASFRMFDSGFFF